MSSQNLHNKPEVPGSLTPDGNRDAGHADQQTDGQDQWDGIQRIVALGDVHGDFPRYLEALIGAGLVDSRGDWIGGSTHFVQIGDIPDRGPDSARVFRHLMQLENQAREAGGQVHALLGNHELMNLTGRLNYVHPGEYEALCSDRAEALRDAYQREQEQHDIPSRAASLYDYAKQSRKQEIPLGYVEHRQHWSLGGEFGGWVAGHHTVIRLNNLLFVHGGISPRFLDWSIRAINSGVRQELRNPEEPDEDEAIAMAQDGPLWYRGMALDDEAADAAHVDALLAFHGVDHVVVGHTPCYETIVPRYDGKVLVIDSGLSSFYGGAITLLLVEGGQLLNLQHGERIPVPVGGDVDALLTYYQRVARLEPDSVALRELISQLEAVA